jgi:hypothetical protein
MSKRPFINDAPQSVRRAVTENDRRVHKATYYAHAASEAAGGRFARQTQSMTVGSRPLVEYPVLPASSPWHRDPVPAEEPLNVDLSIAPIVGEVFEVEKSLAESPSGEGIKDPPTSPPDDQPGGDGPALAQGNSSQGSSEAAPPSPLPKFRKRKP